VNLTARQESAIEAAQEALREVLKAAYPAPADFSVLYMAAIVGAFTTLARAELAPQLLAVINAELKPANLVLARRTGIGAPGHPLTRK
jgi:hypothetical protein